MCLRLPESCGVSVWARKGCKPLTVPGRYIVQPYMAIMPDRELKKGNAELLILALLEEKTRHGYEIGKLIAARSEGVLRFHVARCIHCFIASSGAAGSKANGNPRAGGAGAITA